MQPITDSTKHNDTPASGSAFSGGDALTWLFLFRLILTSVLALIFSYADILHWLPPVEDQRAARLLLSAQAALVLVSGVMIISRRPKRDHQVQLAIFTDIVFAVLLIHVSGGVGSGFGLLPVISVTLGALLLEGRLSLLFAAMASIGVISQQVYANLYVPSQNGTFIEAGFLGLIYFSVALLAHVLMQRVRETERIAARRKVDIVDLSQLNEYVIQRLTTGVLVIDGERRLMQLNSAARRLLHAPSARRGDHLGRLAPTLLAWLETEINGDTAGSRVITLYERELRPNLILLGDERSNGALIFLHDSQELLRQAQDVNLASLGRLSASIAHNIRNPLAAVSHAGQLLAESTQLETEDRRLLSIIRRNTGRLNEIVNSVLELARRHHAEPELFDLCTWVEEACREYCENNRIPSNSISLNRPGGPVDVRADTRHLRQILSNLCDNAREHGAVGGRPPKIEILLERDAQSDAVRITVADDGPGVAAASRQAIFEPFFTSSSSGTGLGLYAARELAEANGLRLEYSGDDTFGSRFTLTFGD